MDHIQMYVYQVSGLKFGIIISCQFIVLERASKRLRGAESGRHHAHGSVLRFFRKGMVDEIGTVISWKCKEAEAYTLSYRGSSSQYSISNPNQIRLPRYQQAISPNERTQFRVLH